MTGSGKSYLMRYLTRNLRRLIVLDPKGTLSSWRCEDFDDRKARRAMQKGEPMRLRATAPIDDEGEYWEEPLWAAYEWGNLTVYCDELYGVVPPGTRAPAILTGLYTRGREYGIGFWSASQRPTWVPIVAISESEHLFMFRLNMQADRQRMAESMGDEVQAPIPESDAHGFYYRTIRETRPAYYPALEASPLAKGGA
jgi:hypothetical protein